MSSLDWRQALSPVQVSFRVWDLGPGLPGERGRRAPHKPERLRGTCEAGSGTPDRVQDPARGQAGGRRLPAGGWSGGPPEGALGGAVGGGAGG